MSFSKGPWGQGIFQEVENHVFFRQENELAHSATPKSVIKRRILFWFTCVDWWIRTSACFSLIFPAGKTRLVFFVRFEVRWGKYWWFSLHWFTMLLADREMIQIQTQTEPDFYQVIRAVPSPSPFRNRPWFMVHPPGVLVSEFLVLVHLWLEPGWLIHLGGCMTFSIADSPIRRKSLSEHELALQLSSDQNQWLVFGIQSGQKPTWITKKQSLIKRKNASKITTHIENLFRRSQIHLDLCDSFAMNFGEAWLGGTDFFPQFLTGW